MTTKSNTSAAIVRAYSNKEDYESGHEFYEIELDILKGLSVRDTVKYIYGNSSFPILSDGNTPTPGVSEEILSHEPEIGLIEWEDGEEMTWTAGAF